jgi:hypothetical protein
MRAQRRCAASSRALQVLVEAQYESMNARHVESSPALPAPAERERRQLEGPAVEEAA